MAKNDSTAKKLGNSFVGMFKRLFVPQKRSALEEEAIQTPMRTVLKNFFRSKLGVIGLVMFVGFGQLAIHYTRPKAEKTQQPQVKDNEPQPQDDEPTR